MDEISGKESLAQLKNVIIIILILIDLIFIITITFFNLPANDIAFMAYFDLFVCLILFINLILTYNNSEESLGIFIKKHLIDIIAIIPFNFIFLRYLILFRVFRLLQVFQVIKILNIKEINVESFKYFVHNQLLKAIALILVFYMILSSVILYVIDNSFPSIFDSFWYSLITVTGVGYGDITPNTYTGKVIGMLTVIIGVLFISVFTAAMSGLYMEKPEEETRRTVRESLTHVKKENEKLKAEIHEIRKNTEKLNEKIDELTELIKND